jgi:hypothetical protein
MVNYNQYTKPTYSAQLSIKVKSMLKDSVPKKDVSGKISHRELPTTKGYHHKSNYVRINFQGGKKQAHRLVWEELNGPIPKDMDISHLCGNSKCIKPDHLHLESHQYNMSRIGCQGIYKRMDKWYNLCTHSPPCKVITIADFKVNQVEEPDSEQ